jgi:PIN domain nuclease of toxin-antitoxin system
VKLLLDTHVWLWSALEPGKLGSKTHALISDPANERYLSIASAWEIVIKAGNGKLDLPSAPAEYVRTRLRRTHAQALPITLDHALAIKALPTIHRDPFDRIIIAQAFIEGMTVLTADRRFDAYGIVVQDARK